MEGAFLGSIVFEFIGAFSKWIYYALKNKGKGQSVPGFYRMWMGRKGANAEGFIKHGFSNVGLGIIVSVITLWILVSIIG